jgi:His-Xaa-Ser system protein HxsD
METQRNHEPNDGGPDFSAEVIPVNSIRLTAKQLAEPCGIEPSGFLGLEVDNAIFSLDAVLRAAYKFTDRCHVFLKSSASENSWLVMLRPKSGAPCGDLGGEFANELIDQRLRERLEQQFGNLRTLIVAQAFSEGNLLDSERSEGDYNEDSRGIGTCR